VLSGTRSLHALASFYASIYKTTMSNFGSNSNTAENAVLHADGIRIVRAEEFDSGTVQTPGSKRVAAIPTKSSCNSQMWAGLFFVDPNSQTVIHHHGVQETIAHVLEGQALMRWGSTVNVKQQPTQVTLSMSHHLCLIGRQTLPAPRRFPGWSSAVRQSQSSSICSMTIGIEIMPPGVMSAPVQKSP